MAMRTYVEPIAHRCATCPDRADRGGDEAAGAARVPDVNREVRIGVIGATGAVGTLTLELLRQRGYRHVRAFASARSAGRELPGGIVVEEATPEALAAGDLDLALFSVGTSASRELVPHAVAGGAVAIDKSSAYRLEPGIPLVVPEVNGARALEHDGIVANPNCCTIPLTAVLKPLHEAAGLARVRVATYQSVSGAGAQAMEALRNQRGEENDLRMDWDFDGEEFDEEAKLRAETRKIMELPDLPVSATCVRVPIMVAHSEAVWIETQEPLSAEQATRVLASAPGIRLHDLPMPSDAAGGDEVLVGRIRPDRAVEDSRGLALWIVNDNLRKGAALNAIQIAELLTERQAVAA
jgi:aspartate-semialdehyde dehydrogenase